MPKANPTVSAHPTKQFFVQMLTRDIDLHDAILDLLDNCIDGAIRATKQEADNPDRYKGFKADLIFQNNTFTIQDNCGGISPELAQHAFMMGRPDLQRDADIPTVGMYGIGMKRAIFKMGRSSQVTSQSEEATFNVTISPDWLDAADNWDLPYEEIDNQFPENGTLITIGDLHPSVQNSFFSNTSHTFMDALEKMISTHYCFIVHKGFKITLNGKRIEPKPLSLLYDQNISPYLYEGVFDGVKVTLAVGFVGQAPSEDEIDANLVQRRTREDAGWTIVCNDRVIVYKDRTALTGWGTQTVPAYHTQFITISGVVEFQSNHAEALPVTTTKRGIDANDLTFLHIKDFMVEGMKLFTNHTNHWKQHKEEEKQLFDKARTVSVRELPNVVPGDGWTQVRNKDNERKFMPTLPRPSVVDPSKQIRFTRPTKDIRIVAEYLFENADTNPADVGALCFDKFLKKIKGGIIE